MGRVKKLALSQDISAFEVSSLVDIEVKEFNVIEYENLKSAVYSRTPRLLDTLRVLYRRDNRALEEKVGNESC